MKVRHGKNLMRWRLVLGAVIALLSSLQVSQVSRADDAALERPGFSLITRDGSGDAGQYTSVAIGADSLGLISYYDVTNRDLKVAHCSDVSCTFSTVTAVDGAAINVGAPSAMAIGADGRGVIAYYDATNGDLKVVHCLDRACASATLTTVHSQGNIGQHLSMTIGADGFPIISYYDGTNGDLRVAHCADVACISATHHALDEAGQVGLFTSITIGTDGRGLISYYDVTNGDLRVAHCADVGCQSATHTVVQSQDDVGQFTTIIIGTDGRGLISYYDATNGDLKVAHCSNSLCVPYHRR